MAKHLTKNNRTKLAGLIEAVCINAQVRPKDEVASYHRYGRGFGLDLAGYRALHDATTTLQSVEPWNEAYTAKVLQTRIIDAIFAGAETYDELVAKLSDTLNADCKHLRAYVAFSGFHLEPDVEIVIGKYVLRVLGESGVEQEIIGRLNQHMTGEDWTEDECESERKRMRGYLKKHANLPILVVEFHGGIEAAQKHVDPIAEGVGLFIQFCIGALTDRYFDNPIIVDHRGRFTGEFAAYMPVMTVDFDQLSFPNLRGFPYDCVISKKDLESLEARGFLDLAEDFIGPASPTPNATRRLLHRAMCAFADAERATSPLTRIASYVTACEVFFSQRLRTEAWVTTGMALSNIGNDGRDFSQQLALAQSIYEDRSRAVHDGFEPEHVYLARKLALGSIEAMARMRHELPTRKKIKDWVMPHVSPEPKPRSH